MEDRFVILLGVSFMGINCLFLKMAKKPQGENQFRLP